MVRSRLRYETQRAGVVSKTIAIVDVIRERVAAIPSRARSRASVRRDVRNILLGISKKRPEAKPVPMDLRERAQYKQEERDRASFLEKKRKEGRRYADRRELMPSSFVDELIYWEDTHVVNVLLNGRWYSVYNVPQGIFTAWFQGAATCMTDDAQRTKRWIVGKTPSLGAFFNHYIKSRKYRIIRGAFTE